MYIHMFTSMCTHTHTHTHARTHAHTHTHTHTHTHKFLSIIYFFLTSFVNSVKCVLYLFLISICVSACMYVCAYVRMYIRTYTCTSVLVCIHTFGVKLVILTNMAASSHHFCRPIFLTLSRSHSKCTGVRETSNGSMTSSVIPALRELSHHSNLKSLYMVRIPMYVHTYVYVHTSSTYVCTYTHTHPCMHAHLQAHTRTHAYECTLCKFLHPTRAAHFTVYMQVLRDVGICTVCTQSN